MRIKMSFLTLAAFFLFPTVSTMPSPDTQIVDGNDLLRGCNQYVKQADGTELETKDYADAFWCLGYMTGYVDGYETAKTVAGFTGTFKDAYCAPDKVSAGQLARIVTKWLKDNPQHLHKRAAISVYSALIDAFPCK